MLAFLIKSLFSREVYEIFTKDPFEDNMAKSYDLNHLLKVYWHATSIKRKTK